MQILLSYYLVLTPFLNKISINIYLMEQKSKPERPKSKKQKIYFFCRTLFTLILTFIALIPIIYLLGSDESFYSNQPLYSVYAQSSYFQSKISEIQSSLNNTLIVNVFSQQGGEKKDSSIRQWQNLREFVSYLAYYLNQKGLVTVDRLITPPQIKQQKKSKSNSNSNVENQQILQKAYDLHSIGGVNILRNKLNKVAIGTINKLKTKVKEPKDSGLVQKLKYGVYRQIFGQRIWIITIHPDYHQYHSPQELKKQLASLSKQRELDRFIIVSIAPADSQSKKIKYITININDSILANLKESMKKVVKSYFSFQINTTRFIETILCRSQASLLQLNHFITRCNSTFNCYNSIKLSRKNKQEKGNKFAPLLNQLCDQGHIDDDDDDDNQYKSSLKELGFYPNQQDNQQIEENLKIYYQIGNGKKCKGNKKCNYQWLSDKGKQKQKKKSSVKVTKQIKTGKQVKTNQQGKKIIQTKQVKIKQKNIKNSQKNEKNINPNIKQIKQVIKNSSKSQNSLKDSLKNAQKIKNTKKQQIKQIKQRNPKKQVQNKSPSKVKAQVKSTNTSKTKNDQKNKVIKTKKDVSKTQSFNQEIKTVSSQAQAVVSQENIIQTKINIQSESQKTQSKQQTIQQAPQKHQQIASIQVVQQLPEIVQTQQVVVATDLQKNKEEVENIQIDEINSQTIIQTDIIAQQSDILSDQLNQEVKNEQNQQGNTSVEVAPEIKQKQHQENLQNLQKEPQPAKEQQVQQGQQEQQEQQRTQEQQEKQDQQEPQGKQVQPEQIIVQKQQQNQENQLQIVQSLPQETPQNTQQQTTQEPTQESQKQKQQVNESQENQQQVKTQQQTNQQPPQQTLQTIGNSQTEQIING